MKLILGIYMLAGILACTSLGPMCNKDNNDEQCQRKLERFNRQRDR
jgi:hypothetical protein